MLLNEYNSRGCGGSTGDAWKFASREKPVSIDEVARDARVTPAQAAALATVLGVALGTLIIVVAAPEAAAVGVLACLVGAFLPQK